MEGFPGGMKFKPEAPVRRYEMVLYTSRIFDKLQEIKQFKFPIVISGNHVNLSDIPDEGFYYLSIAANYFRGFVEGYPDGTFKGKKPATIKDVKLVLQRIKEKTEALLKEKELQSKPPLEPTNP